MTPKSGIFSGSCSGDSGGPLYVEDSSLSHTEKNVHKKGGNKVKYILIGITSRGSGRLGETNTSTFSILTFGLRNLCMSIEGDQ